MKWGGGVKGAGGGVNCGNRFYKTYFLQFFFPLSFSFILGDFDYETQLSCFSFQNAYLTQDKKEEPL